MVLFVCGLSCVFFACFKNSIDSSKINYSFKEEVFSGSPHPRLPAILKSHAYFLPLRGQQSLFDNLLPSRLCAGATWLAACHCPQGYLETWRAMSNQRGFHSGVGPSCDSDLSFATNQVLTLCGLHNLVQDFFTVTKETPTPTCCVAKETSVLFACQSQGRARVLH